MSERKAPETLEEYKAQMNKHAEASIQWLIENSDHETLRVIGDTADAAIDANDRPYSVLLAHIVTVGITFFLMIEMERNGVTDDEYRRAIDNADES